MKIDKQIEIEKLLKEANLYFSSVDLLGSEAAGAESNQEMGMICLSKVEQLRKEIFKNGFD